METSVELATADPAQAVVAVNGEIDMTVHDLLLDTLMHAARVPGVKTVTVDLSQTSFLDSGGVRVLVSGRSAALARGVDYQVTGVHGLTQRVLAVTGVLPLLTGDENPAVGSDGSR
ncbi:STAS domain-containing protein [Catellatospora sp. NPDC049609]|uniref:STAS domain-containing protein n=1 Tax=Catellatospora sp. NPDC049609 TaxID=3155505 RepID=UPI003441C313